MLAAPIELIGVIYRAAPPLVSGGGCDSKTSRPCVLAGCQLILFSERDYLKADVPVCVICDGNVNLERGSTYDRDSWGRGDVGVK